MPDKEHERFKQLIQQVDQKNLSERKDSDQLTDVAINVYGKPYNTAATLYSLLKYSGRWIDKIYFVEERKQPHNSSFQFIKDALGHRMVSYKPVLWLSWLPFNLKFLYRIKSFRLSVRYQYAWEKTDKDFLFITHNDVLYQSDILEAMLNKIGNNIGTGPVGMCWNCSAFFAGLCSPEKYQEYKPGYEELVDLFTKFPGKRTINYHSKIKKGKTWPLPECRLNEWSALINMKLAKPVTLPFGKGIPFGAMFGVDIATKWFSEVLKQGYTVANFSLQGFASHAWSSFQPNGHSALFNKNEYDYSENLAKEYLAKEYEAVQNRKTINIFS